MTYMGPRPDFLVQNMTKTGKVHVENFDDVGDDSTPIASPIKLYGGGSSPYKAKREEEEEPAEFSVLLDEQRDKPANRGSPKRASVGSSRSRSPRRQIARPDNDDSDREGDARNKDGRARNRSAAASPHSRNSRGRGGKGKEDNGDESDAARAAPRSDLDNSISGYEPEGTRWQTSAPGRSSPTGGTRTHKSPAASPRPRREKSSKAARNDDEEDDEGEDGERDNGASPRDHKAGRRGDWEQQKARSNAVQSQPRRRKPNGDNQPRSRRRGNRDGDEDDDEE